jgi:OmpA-OmpF porin, OOP family
VSNMINQLTNDFRACPLTRMASAIGENATKTQTALGAVLPALLRGLAKKATTPQGANEILDIIRKNNLDSSTYADISGAIGAPDGVAKLINTGRPLVELALGDRGDSVTDWLSSFAGISRPSAMSLMSLTIPLVLGAVSRKMSPTGSRTASLRSFLQGQVAMQTAPAGLAAALGQDEERRAPIVGTYDASPRIETMQIGTVGGAYDFEQRGSWWKVSLPLLALGLLGYFFSDRTVEKPQVSTLSIAQPLAPAPKTAEPAVVRPAAPALGPFMERQLANSVRLNVPENGIESKLVAFIQDSSRPVDKDTWFSFDRLEFNTDSATLKPSSEEQLRNIAEILKAYPQVRVKIGGYTDNVGDDVRNVTLSQNRAINTMNEIVNLGIDRARLKAEGYGEKFPVADNSTEEGRQRNRRIEIRVTSK